MKPLKHITIFLILSLLFQATVCAENLALVETSINNSVEKNDSVQSFSNLGMYPYIDTETESLVSFAQPDNIPQSLDNEISKKAGLLNRSSNLSLAYVRDFKNYDRDFFNKLFKKEIIFPFHSFW